MSNRPTDNPFSLPTVVSMAERSFPGGIRYIWPDNVIHPMDVFFARIPPGRNVQTADVANLMMRLWGHGCVEPVRFMPTYSQAAFMGLESGGVRYNKAKEPCAGSAAAWTWRCTPTAELNQLLRELKSP